MYQRPQLAEVGCCGHVGQDHHEKQSGRRHIEDNVNGIEVGFFENKSVQPEVLYHQHGGQDDDDHQDDAHDMIQYPLDRRKLGPTIFFLL